MNNELNTLLTTLYVYLDDSVLPRLGVTRTRLRGDERVAFGAVVLRFER